MLSLCRIAVQVDGLALLSTCGCIPSFDEAEDVKDWVLQETKHVRRNEPEPNGNESLQDVSPVVADNNLGFYKALDPRLDGSRCYRDPGAQVFETYLRWNDRSICPS